MNNVVIKSEGPIWEKLFAVSRKTKSIQPFTCTMYCMNMVILGSNTTYFTVYRPYDSWRGNKPVRRYELQPLIDAITSREHHCLLYNHVEEVVRSLEESSDGLPLWLKPPDFYLLSEISNNYGPLNQNSNIDQVAWKQFLT